MSERRRFSSNSSFEKEFAYSRVVVDGDWVMVSGTTGYDYNTMTISPDPAVQAKQCFENIKTALADAGADLADVVRVTYLVPNRDDVPAFGPIFREYMGAALPAATMLVTGLLDEAMKIEIEITARMASRSAGQNSKYRINNRDRASDST